MSDWIENYSSQATNFALYPNAGANMIYPVLGLCGESGELLAYTEEDSTSEGFRKEVCDVLWYVNACCREFDIDFPGVVGEAQYLAKMITDGKLEDGRAFKALKDDTKFRTPIALFCQSRIAAGAGQVAEALKKIIRDEADIELLAKISQGLCLVVAWIIILGEHAGYTLEEIAALNIEKLTDRRNRSKIQGKGDDR